MEEKIVKLLVIKIYLIKFEEQKKLFINKLK